MAGQPDILLLYSDQHAAQIAGFAGDAVVRTPHLDALAADGVRMTNAYCPSPICLPSRMSFLTGRAPADQSCWTNRDILPSGMPTFAHSLGAAGYAPWLAGRMHSIGPDQMRGYTRREVGDHSPNWLGGTAHDLGPLSRANDPWRESLVASGPGRSAYETYDSAVTEAAVAMLREAGEQRRNGIERPIALTVGWILPHAPYVCDPALYDHYAARVQPPALPPPSEGEEHPHYRWWRTDRGIADATAPEIARARAAYYGLVETLDAQVGRVLSALEEAGLAETTLVVYLSDHGEHLGERGLWWKSTLYDESAKVPLVLRGPGLPRGETRGSVVNLTDLTATLLDLAQAPALPGAQGAVLLGFCGRPRRHGTTRPSVNMSMTAFRLGQGAARLSSGWCGEGATSIFITTGYPASFLISSTIRTRYAILQATRLMAPWPTACEDLCCPTGTPMQSSPPWAGGRRSRHC